MKKLNWIFFISLATFSLSFLSNVSLSQAADPKDPMQAGPRKKEIDFEGRVIEGLGGRNYDSLSQTGSVDAGSKDKLYKKRAEFDDESKYLLREMEYLK